MMQLVFEHLNTNCNLRTQDDLLLHVAAEAQTPNFEPVQILVPLVLHPRTAAVACFVLK